jgi:hypothetical protein
MANNCVLRGHPCRTEHLIGIGPDVYPFICINDVALLYRFCIRCWKRALKPYVCRSLYI